MDGGRDGRQNASQTPHGRRWQPDTARRPGRVHRNRRRRRGARSPFLHINNSCALNPMADVQNEEEEEEEREVSDIP